LRLSRRLDLGRLRGEISLGILAFIFGMLIVVQSLHDGGVTARLGEFLASAGSSSPAATIVVTTVGTALGSNLINNLPMALLMVPTLHGVTSAIRPDMIYSTILGCDLGPNLTHLGSLATFIWLFFLRRRGLQVSAWDYFKLGAVVTPVLLASATLGLWVTAG
ncbi:MAG: ArsB/NhaD family transporter, partial [Chloroflexota bacterium]